MVASVLRKILEARRTIALMQELARIWRTEASMEKRSKEMREFPILSRRILVEKIKKWRKQLATVMPLRKHMALSLL